MARSTNSMVSDGGGRGLGVLMKEGVVLLIEGGRSFTYGRRVWSRFGDGRRAWFC